MLNFFRLVPKKRTVKIKSKNGVIFSNPQGKRQYLFYTGTLIIAIAFVYLIYLYWPLADSWVAYKTGKITMTTPEETTTEQTGEIGDLNEFWIKIPKIGAAADIEKYISPFDKEEYLAVIDQDLVAHAKGSGLPGEADSAIYLFAHSTRQGLQTVRKNSVFYLLGELENGDIIFIKYEGRVYKYRVYDSKIVGADEIEYLEYKDESKTEVLILQTCWPIGTDWKRLLIFGERI